jgi:hypothetical protein
MDETGVSLNEGSGYGASLSMGTLLGERGGGLLR